MKKKHYYPEIDLYTDLKIYHIPKRRMDMNEIIKGKKILATKLVPAKKRILCSKFQKSTHN